LRQLVGHLLKRAGYTVLLAASGPAAVELWREHGPKIQLLLTDVIMPDGMTGRQLAEKLQGERPGLKVIYTSGYSADVLKEGPKLVEGINFLQKPFEAHKLVQAVRDSLDGAGE
jgi:CheY-like chemotaxis protein